MNILYSSTLRRALICGVAATALLSMTPAMAQDRLTIPAQPLDAALRELAEKTGVDILFTPQALRGLRSASVDGPVTARSGAEAMIVNADLEVVAGAGGSLIVRPRASSAAQRSGSGDVTSDDIHLLGDIIVTASKRQERLLEVPAAISALSGEDLRRTQSYRFEDYLTKVPGLNFVSSGQGTTQLILRGITSGTSQVSSTVGVYIDEAPFGSSTVFASGAFGTPDFDTSDIARVEVLKGPQGTLYGANALGGVLKFVTTPPDPSRYSANASVGASVVDGGGDGYRVSGAVNIPLVTDTLALRVSAFDRRDPGYIDDPSRGRTDINEAFVQGARAALLWKPADDVTVTLTAMAQDLDARNSSSEDVLPSDLRPETQNRAQIRFFDGRKQFRYRAYNATVDWDLGWADLISSTGYSTFASDPLADISRLLGAPVRVVQPVRQEKTTQEFRLQSPTSDRLEWRAGVFFTHEDSRQEQHIRLFDPVTLEVSPLPVVDAVIPSRYTEYAAFGDVTYHFSPRFDVTVGGRFSRNDQKFSETLSGVFVPVPADFARETSDESVNWLINPRFRITEDAMLYGRVATGYRPGGPTLAVPNQVSPKEFDPDTITNYEAGYKAVLLDNRLTVDANVFFIDWQDIQLNQTVGGFTYITNGGAARSRGAEFAATLAPIDGLFLNGSLAYTDAELTEDAPGAGGVDGDRLPGAPRWSAAFDVDYERQLAPGWEGFAGASYRRVGDRESDFQLGAGGPARRYTLDAYDIVDLRVGARHDGWSVTAYVRNLGDTRGLVALGPNTPDVVNGSYSAGLVQPRTFGLDLSARF